VVKNRFWVPLVQIIFLLIYFLEFNIIITTISLFIVIVPIIYYFIDDVFSDRNLFYPFLNMTIIIILAIHYSSHSKIVGERWITEGAKNSFVYSKDREVIPLNTKFAIQKFAGKNYIYIYSLDNKVNKLEYNNKIKTDSLMIETLKTESYKTGNYFVEVRSNINNSHMEYLLANNGDFTFNNIKVKMFEKSDNFKNKYGKALRIGYKYPNNKRGYRHWIFLKYPDFNNSLEATDPLSFIYKGDEIKHRYFVKVIFLSPFKNILFIISVILLFMVSFMRLKNENKNI